MIFVLTKVEEVRTDNGELVYIHHFGLDPKNPLNRNYMAGILQVASSNRLPIDVGSIYETPSFMKEKKKNG